MKRLISSITALDRGRQLEPASLTAPDHSKQLGKNNWGWDMRLSFSGQCSNAGCESTMAITRVFFRYRPPYNSCHICSKVFEHNVSQRIKNIGLDLSTLAKQKCLRSIQWKNKYIDNVILNPHIYWLLMSWRHAYSSVFFQL